MFCIALYRKSSYGASPAVWRHTLLPAIWLRWTRPALTSSRQVDLPIPEGWKAKLSWAAGYIPRWFTWPQAVTHPSTNPARRRTSLLIGHKVLPLRHVTKRSDILNLCYHLAKQETWHNCYFLYSNLRILFLDNDKHSLSRINLCQKIFWNLLEDWAEAMIWTNRNVGFNAAATRSTCGAITTCKHVHHDVIIMFQMNTVLLLLASFARRRRLDVDCNWRLSQFVCCFCCAVSRTKFYFPV